MSNSNFWHNWKNLLGSFGAEFFQNISLSKHSRWKYEFIKNVKLSMSWIIYYEQCFTQDFIYFTIFIKYIDYNLAVPRKWQKTSWPFFLVENVEYSFFILFLFCSKARISTKWFQILFRIANPMIFDVCLYIIHHDINPAGCSSKTQSSAVK